MVAYYGHDCHMQGKMVYSCLSPCEDGDLHFYEGADMLLIWLLRARSYKTKAEA